MNARMAEDTRTRVLASFPELLGLLGDVYFDADKYALRPDARSQLDSHARFMHEYPTWKLLIEGYSDERGTESHNFVLAEQRTQAVRRYLTSLGIASERIQAASYGETRPVCTEQAESCWWRNRRARLVIVGEDRG